MTKIVAIFAITAMFIFIVKSDYLSAFGILILAVVAVVGVVTVATSKKVKND